MPYHSKNGAIPVSHLPMQDIGPDGRVYTHLESDPIVREILGWDEIPSPPDYNSVTEQAVWEDGDWNIVPKAVNLRVSHKEFLDLLTIPEQIKLTAAQKQLADMSAEDFIAPGNAMWQMFSVLMNQFDKSSMIELSNQQTINAFAGVLVPMNIFTSERSQQILTRQPPPV